MDTKSGNLKFSAIDVNRDHVKGTKKGCFGIIPSSSSIQCVATKLAAYADDLIPLIIFETSTGEGIKFDYVKLLQLLL